MPKLKTIFLIFIGLMALLFASNWASTSYLKSQAQKNQLQIGTQASSSEPLSIEEMIKQGSYRTVSADDQKLSMKCPADWIEMGGKDLLEYFSQETIGQYQMEIPFAAAKKDGGQLVVIKISMEASSTLKDALEANKSIYEKEGHAVSILSQNEGKNELYFKAEYSKGEEKMASMEKILKTGTAQGKNDFYIVSFIVPSGRIEAYEEAGEEVMGSIQFNN